MNYIESDDELLEAIHELAEEDIEHFMDNLYIYFKSIKPTKEYRLDSIVKIAKKHMKQMLSEVDDL